jgi:hypothetical protein
MVYGAEPLGPAGPCSPSLTTSIVSLSHIKLFKSVAVDFNSIARLFPSIATESQFPVYSTPSKYKAIFSFALLIFVINVVPSEVFFNAEIATVPLVFTTV